MYLSRSQPRDQSVSSLSLPVTSSGCAFLPPIFPSRASACEAREKEAGLPRQGTLGLISRALQEAAGRRATEQWSTLLERQGMKWALMSLDPTLRINGMMSEVSRPGRLKPTYDAIDGNHPIVS